MLDMVEAPREYLLGLIALQGVEALARGQRLCCMGRTVGRQHRHHTGAGGLYRCFRLRPQVL